MFSETLITIQRKTLKHTTDAARIHRTFKALAGSEHIASDFAIGALVKWIRKLRPHRVLEVGAGIGTLTFALCSLKQEIPFELITVEWNGFCQNAMRDNLSEQRGDYQQISSMDELGEFEPLDLVVIDGGEQDARFISRLSPRAVIFIEGFMDKKHSLIHETYKGKRQYIWSNFRSSDRRKGIWIFRFEPTTEERAWFAANNFINRVYSAAKRRGLIAERESI